MCLWLYIIWFLGNAQAGDITLWYSTSLDTLPTILVEQQGMTQQIVPERKGMEGDFYVWSIAWDTQSSWVSQVHIEHPFEETISTVVMGRMNEQELFLLNDMNSKKTQWMSTTGGFEQTRALEKWYRSKSLLWFTLSGLLCVILAWFKPLSSTNPSHKWLDRFSKTPFWLTTLLSFVFFIGVSLWFQRFGLGLKGIPAVYHDALGSYWMIGRSGVWDGFFDSTTQFPIGTDYRSLDSYTLWLSAQVLSFLEPHALYGLWIVLGPALSGCSAELLARECDVKAPWSLMAGLVFAFSGLVQNALLEGQIYQTLLVGLPCLVISIRRFLASGTFSWLWWMGSVFSFALCMFTSSYIGASALLLMLGWWLGSKGWKDIRTVYVILGILPVLWFQYQSMSSVDGLGVRDAMKVSIGSLSWDNFWGASPEMFRERHSIALGLSIVGCVLSMLSITSMIRKKQMTKWTPLLCMGGVSLLFAMGPTWHIDAETGWTFFAMEWIYGLPGVSSIGFPIRLAQPFVLMMAVLSAFGLQRLVKQTPIAMVLLPLAFWNLDTMDFSNRQKVWPIDAPVLETVPEGAAIFTLYPEAYDRIQGSDADIELYMQDCVAQVSHGHPISNHCISVDVHGSQSKHLQQKILSAIVEHRSVWEILEPLGIQHLLIYPEWFLPNDRERVQRALQYDSVLVEEGTNPLQYWVYQYDSQSLDQPILIEETNQATVTIDLWTSKDHDEPILMLGDGILQESKLSTTEQFIRHRFVFRTQKFTLPLIMQNSDGVVFWDDVLHFNSLKDHIVIREGQGQQIELPLIDSPYVSTDLGGVHGLLFGSMLAMFGLAWVVGRRE